jgi:5,10-methylenetetrahydromethanopterin reductase
MRVGLFLGDTGTLDTTMEHIVQAERDGFDSAWLGQIFQSDALTILALAGRQTERIELGTAVVPTYPRHPFMLAQQALTVQVATGGRLSLGIGPSHQLVVETLWGLSYEHPARHMREYLSVLRPLLSEGRVSFNGEVFRVNAGLQIAAQPCPVLIAALAPVMLRIAGELTDGTITWMTGVKTVETHIVPRITRAASEAGRPQPRVCVALPVAVTDDPAGAKERAATQFQMYGQLPNYQRVLAREGAAGPADVVIAGSEAEVERRVRALASAGATDFLAVQFSADDKDSFPRTRALLQGLVGRV